ncbi:DUF4296 domain-containing protein [Fluviicola chungangensis]|uniref:DUF4296 domain-containing protein n=1 Tax=Fluviicola chungangensis TaxID=2597671 RepID=A0A556MQ10_9FLAO|nr:DUF4296 domain-containing protein [Fluviicola chungangensis]TSJ41955.1 DUF4296 domain-containing protein [Fluviicola chungangensis]
MKKILGICLFILLQSCDSELHGLEKPENLIPKDQMITLMTDMLILEGHIQTTYSTVNRYYKVMTASGRDYLKSKHITEKQYEDSFMYYTSMHEEYKLMLDKVMENLQKESIELQKKT